MGNSFHDNDFAFKYVCRACSVEHDPLFSEPPPADGIMACGSCRKPMMKVQASVLTQSMPVTDTERLNAQVLAIAEVAKRFCDRVEAGEVKSLATYTKFRDALQLLDDQQKTELLVIQRRLKLPEDQENERLANAARALTRRLVANGLAPEGFDPGAIEDRVMALVYEGKAGKSRQMPTQPNVEAEQIPSSKTTVNLSF